MCIICNVYVFDYVLYCYVYLRSVIDSFFFFCKYYWYCYCNGYNH